MGSVQELAYKRPRICTKNKLKLIPLESNFTPSAEWTGGPRSKSVMALYSSLLLVTDQEVNYLLPNGPAVLGQSRLWHCIRSCYW